MNTFSIVVVREEKDKSHKLGSLGVSLTSIKKRGNKYKSVIKFLSNLCINYEVSLNERIVLRIFVRSNNCSY